MTLNSLGCDIPCRSYTAEQVRQLDAIAIEKRTGGGYSLMRLAGKAAFDLLCQLYPDCRHISIVCGGGNNGGDGYVVAELALKAGFQVELLAVTDSEKLSGEAQQAYQSAHKAGVIVKSWTADADFAGQLIVDALLGTGLTGSVRADFAAVIKKMNQAGLPVLAIDIPSGLAADTGMPLGATVNAVATMTFIGIKQGLLTGLAVDYTGQLWFDDLKVGEEVYASVPCNAELITLNQLRKLLPPRKKSSHKGDFGHVLVIGGDVGFGGAALLAAEAALFAGAGMVSCATKDNHVTAGLARQPDIMYRHIEQRSALQKMIAKADVLVVGPGLGTEPWGQMCLHTALESGLPLVVDADGLNQLAGLKDVKASPLPLPPQSVITPHPGEAARLIKCDTATIINNRFAAVRELSQVFGCTALLKGFGTLICSSTGICSSTEFIAEESEQVAVTSARSSKADLVKIVSGHGNPGMAKAGMGDVLAGITGALLAQGLTGFSAAQFGACWHAAAADLIAGSCGETSVSASRIPEFLGTSLSELQH